jgi:hypothetical protein
MPKFTILFALSGSVEVEAESKEQAEEQFAQIPAAELATGCEVEVLDVVPEDCKNGE